MKRQQRSSESSQHGFTLVELPVMSLVELRVVPFDTLRPRSGRKRAAFTLVELLVVIAIIGVLVALLLPAIQAAREAARRAHCQSNIKNAALAVLNYESAFNELPHGMTFPPELEGNIHRLTNFGKNWIISVLPYLEEQPLYDSFNFKRPINDPSKNAAINVNSLARGQQIPVLLCPSDPNNQVLYQGAPGSGHGGNWARGNYAANSGNAYLISPAGCDPKELCTSGPDSDGWLSNRTRGVMGPNVSVKLRRVLDGTSKTILVGEIRTGLTEKDARGVWALGHAGASLLAMYGSRGDANGPNACYPLSDDVYSDACGLSDTVAQCMDCDHGDYFAQATTRSVHPGGAYIAMTDGSVTFISDDIETSGHFGNWGTLWDRLIASADDGIPGDVPGSMPE
jgi:prepilin-type N-terminal cleavage/methylation domain-containing protein